MWTLKKIFISQYLEVLEVILQELRETEPRAEVELPGPQ